MCLDRPAPSAQSPKDSLLNRVLPPLAPAPTPLDNANGPGRMAMQLRTYTALWSSESSARSTSSLNRAPS